MMEVIHSKEGLHLVYSQFLTIEGLGVFGEVLNAHDFVEFKLKRSDQGWELDIPKKDWNKRMYMKYIGTKKIDEKEVLRNIFNRDQTSIPENLKEAVAKMNIDIFMITAAGAEGISLKNVQFVHIMEPYWNPVRLDQVIGRARRICSHTELPQKDQYVETHLYLMVIPDAIAKDVPSLKMDKMIIHGKEVVATTDMYLYEKSEQKRKIRTSILNCVQSASMDCFLHSKNCFPYTALDPTVLSYIPDIDAEQKDSDRKTNITLKTVTLKTSAGPISITYSPTDLLEFEGINYYKLHIGTKLIGYVSTSEDKSALNLKMEKLSNIQKLYSEWKKTN